ncbi:MAG TPA: hypothetical protein VJ938_04695 [Acidimicrobiia bacterium]|nr:hypothetical protein [Acidimicrobiia bacterium]
MSRFIRPRLLAGVAVLAAILAIPMVVVASHDFVDVDDSNVFHEDIDWLADAGVTKGCNPPANTEFCPSASVTREQMAAFLRRLAEGQVVDAGTLGGMTLQEILAGAPSSEPLFIDPDLPFVGVNRDFQISGNEVFGVTYDGVAGEYGGMYIDTSDPGGWPFYGYATGGAFEAWTYFEPATQEWRLYNAGNRLASSVDDGLRVENGPTDGIQILDTADDGIQIGSDPNYPSYGVYIPSPGVTTYGLWPNTANAAGEWAVFTVDDISAGNVTAASVSQVAMVSEGQSLSPGDVVAVTGVAQPLAGSGERLPAVTTASATGFTGMIGVVESRMVFEAPAGKDEPALQSVEGAAQPGEYVSLIVSGVADVKVSSTSGISEGTRLTASDSAGRVRALETRQVDGIEVAEGAPVIGIALESPAEGATTVPVYVTFR